MQKTGYDFIRLTHYDHLSLSDQSQGIDAPPLEQAYDGPGPIIHLPKTWAVKHPDLLLDETIAGRRSIRRFSSAPIMLEDLSWLLWCSQGVQKVISPATIRTVPSAGARHPLDTFVLLNRIKGLRAGLYRFLALEHAVAPVDLSAQIAAKLQDACLEQNMIASASAAFFWVADIYRSAWRYSERAWRYVFLDAGHACQNLYLGAASVECGVCAIAAFDDVKLNRLLGVDGERNFVVYAAAAGKLPAR